MKQFQDVPRRQDFTTGVPYRQSKYCLQFSVFAHFSPLDMQYITGILMSDALVVVDVAEVVVTEVVVSEVEAVDNVIFGNVIVVIGVIVVVEGRSQLIIGLSAVIMF